MSPLPSPLSCYALYELPPKNPYFFESTLTSENEGDYQITVSTCLVSRTPILHTQLNFRAISLLQPPEVRNPTRRCKGSHKNGFGKEIFLQIQGKEGNNIEGNSASLAIQARRDSKVAILLLVIPCNPPFLSLLSLFEIRSLIAQDR
jgi:hypothetical protein